MGTVDVQELVGEPVYRPATVPNAFNANRLKPSMYCLLKADNAPLKDGNLENRQGSNCSLIPS